MKAHRLAFRIGQGLLAGLAGTAAITASQTIEILFTGRTPSDTPARAAQKVFGIEPRDERSKGKLEQSVHWAYGTAWGLFRSVLASLGMRGAPATFLHWAAVQQGAIVFLPAMKIAPPAKEWERKELGTELFHHFAYALAAGAAFDGLENSARGFFRGCVKIIPSALLGALFSFAFAPFFLLQGKPGQGRGPARETKRVEAEEVTRPSPRAEVHAEAG